jgi:transposase-like protein
MASRAVEDVIRMFRGGVGIAQIADAVELPIATVTALLLRGGVEDTELESVGEGRRIGELGSIRVGVVSDDLKRLVIADWMLWMPMGQICKKYELHRNMVWQILLEEGVPVRKRTVMKELIRLRRDAEIVDLYVGGMHVLDIAAAVGLGHGMVNEVLRKYNVPRRVVKRGPVRRSRGGFGEMVHPRDILHELS